MKEVIHVNNQTIYEIPANLSHEEIKNLKQISLKGIFECLYCDAQLRVRSGAILGTFLIEKVLNHLD